MQYGQDVGLGIAARHGRDCHAGSCPWRRPVAHRTAVSHIKYKKLRKLNAALMINPIGPDKWAKKWEDIGAEAG